MFEESRETLVNFDNGGRDGCRTQLNSDARGCVLHSRGGKLERLRFGTTGVIMGYWV